MLGKKAGVATKMLEMFLHLIVWHCADHFIELRVSDVVRELLELCLMKIFFDKLYSLCIAKKLQQTKTLCSFVEHTVSKSWAYFKSVVGRVQHLLCMGCMVESSCIV